MATVDAVEIVFKSGGIAEVLAAFRSVEQAMILLEKTQKASGERVAKETVRQHKGAADTVAKEAAKAEKARTAAAEAEAKRRNAIVMNSAKMAGQLAGQQVKEAAAA
jgi:DNA gyrase/topoisomerase IV subunit B